MDLTGTEWRKSSYSGSNGGNCVDVACNLPGTVAVRHSKDPDGLVLVFTPEEWNAFLHGARKGSSTCPDATPQPQTMARVAASLITPGTSLGLRATAYDHAPKLPSAFTASTQRCAAAPSQPRCSS